MVESEAKELSEDVMLGAVMFGHRGFQPVIQAIIELAETCAKEPWDLPPSSRPRPTRSRPSCARRVGPLIEAAYARAGQAGRAATGSTPPRRRSPTLFADEDAARARRCKLFKDLEKEIVRGAILRGGSRASTAATPRRCGRSSVEVGVLPRAHGSALFTRGETQALVVATLGTGQDEQIIDALEGEYRENFMLHYNFPPYSTGEAGRMGSPGRREIGHGKLAWRAVRPLLPIEGQLPLHDPRRLGDHRVERLVVDGLGVRRVARR